MFKNELVLDEEVEASDHTDRCDRGCSAIAEDSGFDVAGLYGIPAGYFVTGWPSFHVRFWLVRSPLSFPRPPGDCWPISLPVPKNPK